MTYVYTMKYFIILFVLLSVSAKAQTVNLNDPGKQLDIATNHAATGAIIGLASAGAGIFVARENPKTGAIISAIGGAIGTGLIIESFTHVSKAKKLLKVNAIVTVYPNRIGLNLTF